MRSSLPEYVPPISIPFPATKAMVLVFGCPIISTTQHFSLCWSCAGSTSLSVWIVCDSQCPDAHVPPSLCSACGLWRLWLTLYSYSTGQSRGATLGVEQWREEG